MAKIPLREGRYFAGRRANLTNTKCAGQQSQKQMDRRHRRRVSAGAENRCRHIAISYILGGVSSLAISSRSFMFVIRRLLLALGASCLWINAAQAVAGSGQIEARLVITAGCEVTQHAVDGRPAVHCSTAPEAPTQFTVSTDQGTLEDGSPRTLVTLNW
jgi:hypothetical protein